MSKKSIIWNPYFIIRNGLYNSISKLAPLIHGDILDFGCGSKPYESLFTNASSYLGVDIEVSGHDHATSKVDVFYDGKSLPFPEESFDAVVSFEVFEHVFNPSEALKEIYRVLKPGGILLTSTPFAWDEHEVPFDFARYTSFGIQDLHQRNGFSVKSVSKTTSTSLAISQLEIAYLQQHVFPSKGVSGRLSQLLIIFPKTIWAYLKDLILPRREDLFSNAVVLSRKSNTYEH